MEPLKLTAIVDPMGTGYVALCPNLDIASEGATREEALANLHETLELFFEVAPAHEVARRFHQGVSVIRASTPGGDDQSRP